MHISVKIYFLEKRSIFFHYGGTTVLDKVITGIQDTKGWESQPKEVTEADLGNQ
jgi:hypothetical protein